MRNDDERRTNGGAQALEARIIAEAQKDAEAQLEAANERAREILEEGERETARISMEAVTLSQRNENEILSKHRTQAELEAKKYALKQRHALLDNVFYAAYRKIWEMDPRDDRVVRMIYRTMLTEAHGGETVYPAIRHRDAVRIAIGRVNEQFVKAHRPQLTMGDVAPTITGGFILDGGTYTKDCSLQAIMDDVRDREIVAVSKALFQNRGASSPAPQAQAVKPPERNDASETSQPGEASEAVEAPETVLETETVTATETEISE